MTRKSDARCKWWWGWQPYFVWTNYTGCSVRIVDVVIVQSSYNHKITFWTSYIICPHKIWRPQIAHGTPMDVQWTFEFGHLDVHKMSELSPTDIHWTSIRRRLFTTSDVQKTIQKRI
ncbi:hypothetical protein CAJAP_01919 [Camponotus japonicus]